MSQASHYVDTGGCARSMEVEKMPPGGEEEKEEEEELVVEEEEEEEGFLFAVRRVSFGYQEGEVPGGQLCRASPCALAFRGCAALSYPDTGSGRQ